MKIWNKFKKFYGQFPIDHEYISSFLTTENIKELVKLAEEINKNAKKKEKKIS